MSVIQIAYFGRKPGIPGAAKPPLGAVPGIPGAAEPPLGAVPETPGAAEPPPGAVLETPGRRKRPRGRYSKPRGGEAAHVAILRFGKGNAKFRCDAKSNTIRREFLLGMRNLDGTLFQYYTA